MGGTALPFDPHRLLVLGGDDGEIARLLEANARRAGTSEERTCLARIVEISGSSLITVALDVSSRSA
jgi:hypothetical protein